MKKCKHNNIRKNYLVIIVSAYSGILNDHHWNHWLLHNELLIKYKIIILWLCIVNNGIRTIGPRHNFILEQLVPNLKVKYKIFFNHLNVL